MSRAARATGKRLRSLGFTVVELVVVIVLLGIVSAIAAPRFFDDRPFLERGYYEELVAALQYAQKLAIASGCAVRLEIDADGYAASQQRALAGRCDPADASWTTAVALSDGQPLTGAAPSGVSVSPAVTLTFDALGRTNLDSDRTLNVGAFALMIVADSGYIQAQ